jgi:hypothetical protein
MLAMNSGVDGFILIARQRQHDRELSKSRTFGRDASLLKGFQKQSEKCING